jgi:hypothetical protein
MNSANRADRFPLIGRRYEFTDLQTDPDVDLADPPTLDDLTAALDPSTLERAFHAYLFVEGLRTTDGRASEVGGGIWRDLPQPLEWQEKTGPGHHGAVVVGQINTIERQEQDGYTLLYATGLWDLGGVNGDGVGVTVGDEGLTAGAECARQVALQGGTRWVSSNIEPIEVDVVSARSGEVIEDLWEAFMDGDDEWYEVLTSYRVAGATVVSTPAFPQCVIAPASVPLPIVAPLGAIEPEAVTQPMLVASVTPPVHPPAAWFRQPDLSGPTPLQVTDEGRIYGHLADWRTPHTGYGGRQIYAPHNHSGYRYFLTGEVELEDGTATPCGTLTMGCGHAEQASHWASARAHYDGGPGATQAADVMVGDDAYGIWVAGALRPNLTPEQIREFRALAPSGDWRKISGHLELVASVQVPVPGFPVPRAIAASGAMEFDGNCRQHYSVIEGSDELEMVSLVAAGRVVHDPMRDAFAALSRRIFALEATINAAGISEMAAERLEASLNLD